MSDYDDTSTKSMDDELREDERDLGTHEKEEYDADQDRDI